MTEISRLGRFIKKVYLESLRDDVLNGAAALGFYLTLAIFPAIIFLMALIPFLPIPRVDEALMDLVAQALPGRAAAIFADVVSEVTRERRGGLLSFGLLAALWSSSTGMYAVMQQLNTAFNVVEGRPFLRARSTALALTLLFGVLILGAFSLVVLGGVIQGWLGQRFGFSDTLLVFFRIFRWAIIVLGLLGGVALIYHLAPNQRRIFRLITPGTVTATVLLIAASAGFSLYTSHFNSYTAVYGSIGAVIVLMLSLYIAGLVILIGAEIDATREKHIAQ